VTTVIVGAGTAGCALAARLSEEPDRHVVLIEAGVSGPEIPAELRDAASIRGAMPGHPANWSFLGQLTPELAYTVVRGKVVGGSSAINGGYFIRALLERRWRPPMGVRERPPGLARSRV